MLLIPHLLPVRIGGTDADGLQLFSSLALKVEKRELVQIYLAHMFSMLLRFHFLSLRFQRLKIREMRHSGHMGIFYRVY